ncbi:MAG TPA: GAF domain-containing protein [Solirubrobacteraceae bacterium]|nr:GAF domain-containing protein [Solirubrobacteraceae bacterium]
MITAELLAELLDRAEIGVALMDARCTFRYVNERMADINAAPRDEHLGRTIDEVLPDLAETVRPLVEQAIASRDPLLAIKVDGSPRVGASRRWEASYLPVQLADGPGVGVIVVDVTERTKSAAAIRARLHQQAALADLGQFALRTRDLDGVMGAACSMLADALGAERAGVLEFAPGRDQMIMRAGVGFPPGAVGSMTAQIGPRSQAGFTLASGGPVISDDTAREERFRFSPGLLALGVRSAISVPILAGEEPFGVLGVLASTAGRFDEDDANLVRAAANVLGAAVVRAAQATELEGLAAQRGRLVAQALDAGDRERRHVADALHDEALQHLLFARLELAALDAETDTKARVLASIHEATAVLRRVIGGLHPVPLAHAGLTAALDGLARELAERAGLHAEVRVHPAAEGREDRLVLSLARELLTNVVKHARATRATVRVALDGEALVLEVADDGGGLAGDAFEAALARGNVGLANARERVAALGGSIDVLEGLDGRGARVSIRLPSG